MGPSGSGKSTLMHCMAGLDRLDSRLGDASATSTSRDASEKQLTLLRRDRLGFIFQAFNLVPTLTAIENITLPMELAGRKPDREWLDHVVDHGRPDESPAAPAERAVGRPAAARRRRPCARQPAADHLRRRADRQPRQHDRRRDPRRSCVTPSASSARRS